jgi:hypothetical protein
VGTNDLAKKNPQEIVNGIADIVNIIHVESPATKPVLSEIMMRTDSSSYIPKIGKINQQLQLKLLSGSKYRLNPTRQLTSQSPELIRSSS